MRCPVCGNEIVLDPKELAALLGARGGAAGRGDVKRRHRSMLVEAGRKGAAIRWSKPRQDKP